MINTKNAKIYQFFMRTNYAVAQTCLVEMEDGDVY